MTTSSFTSRTLFIAVCAAVALTACSRPAKVAEGPKPVLTVSVESPVSAQLSERIPAYGGVFAWQEASLGTEVGGLRLMEIHAEVGDVVRKGQVLARLNAEAVKVDLALQEAALADASAALEQASANATRARELGPKGAMSQQDYTAALAAEKSARAKHAMVKAQVEAQRLKLKYTVLTAPDDGVISARAGNVGQIVPAGTELFKLIRQSRLEWRAEIDADTLPKLAEGQFVEVKLPGGKSVSASIRKIAPALDATSRTGMAYVDLPPNPELRPGVYVHGAFLGEKAAQLTVPLTAVSPRDGRQYVLVVDSASKVSLKEVTVGAKTGERVAVSGISQSDKVVAAGGAFLTQGDVVRVVQEKDAR